MKWKIPIVKFFVLKLLDTFEISNVHRIGQKLHALLMVKKIKVDRR
jgi:hypothetical protein